MDIRRIIQVEAVAELPAYHGAMLDAKEVPFVLGVSPAASVPQGDTVSVNDNIEARNYIEAFLKSPPAGGNWYLYQLKIDNATISAEKIRPISSLGGSANDAKLQAALVKWLAARYQVVAADQAFYAAGSEPGEVVDGGGASVGDILRSTLSWDAPVPQKLGLSQVVSVAMPKRDLQPYPRLVVLPFEGQAPDTIESQYIQLLAGDAMSAEPDTELRLRVRRSDFLATGDQIDCLTNSLQRFPDTDIFGVNKGTGFIEDARSGTDELYRLLNAVESAAGARTWAAPALLDAIEEDESYALTCAVQGGIKLCQANVRSLCWLAAAGTVSILDPLLLALAMPGITKSEGHLVATLMDLSLQALENNRDPQLEEDLREAWLASARELHLITTTSTPLAALQQAVHFLDLEKAGTKHDNLMTLLRGYQKNSPPEISSEQAGEYFRSLLSSLESLTTDMQAEGGVERILFRIVDELLGENMPIHSVFQAIWGGQLETGLDKFRQAYKEHLAGDYDALDAMRKTVGFLVSRRMSADGQGDRLELSLAAKCIDSEKLDLFNARFLDTTNPDNPINKLFAGLWRPLSDTWMDKNKLKKALKLRSDVLSEDWLAVAYPLQAPFRLMAPDSAPAPLPIQIGDDADSREAELFEELFSGIGVLIHRSDQAKGDWRHANLVELTRAPDETPARSLAGEIPEKPVVAALTCRTLQPGRRDGRLSLLFPYQGFPLANAAFDLTQLEQDRDRTSKAQEVLRRPFYDAEDLQKADESWQQVPQLAYGRKFQFSAFLRSEGGAIPPNVREQTPTDVYWKPGAPKGDGPVAIEEAIYRRRTAIGRLGLEEARNDGYSANRSRFKNIDPYCEDFPRQGLLAVKDHPDVLDLMRNTDGSGGLLFTTDLKGGAEPESWRIRLDEVSTWGGSELRFEIVGLAAVDVDVDSGGVLQRVMDSSRAFKVGVSPTLSLADRMDILPIEIMVSRQALWVAGTAYEFESEMELDESFWIRLTLKTEADNAALSFGDTSRIDGYRHYFAKPQPPSKILLRPEDEISCWMPDFPDHIDLNLRYPRVGYLDLERWCANGGLSTPFRDKDGKPRPMPEALLEAYLLRGLDSNEVDRELPGSETLSQLLEKLPDPAVHGVLVRLSPVADMRPAKLVLTEKLQHVWRMPEIEVPNKSDFEDEASLAPYRNYLGAIDDALRNRVEVRTGKRGKPPGISKVDQHLVITVPEGMVASLGFDVLVDCKYFVEDSGNGLYAPIDPGIAAHASHRYTNEDGNFMVFRGEEFNIEVMTSLLGEDCVPVKKDLALQEEEPVESDKLRALALQNIVIDAEGSDRAYAICQREFPVQEKPTTQNLYEAKLWRNFSRVEIVTQQWRYMGCPLYNVPSDLDQLSKHAKQRSNRPVLELDGTLDEVQQLEREAYFNRPDVDANFVKKKLEPLALRVEGASSHRSATDSKANILHQLEWGQDSATLFRHRFVYWSRYAGAMKDQKWQRVQSWGSGSERTIDASDQWVCDDQYLNNNEPQVEKQAGIFSHDLADTWTRRVAIRALIRDVELTRPQVKTLIPLNTSASDETDTPPILCVLQESPYQAGGLAERVIGGIAAGTHYGLEDEILRVCDVRKQIGPNPHLQLDRLETSLALGVTVDNEGPIGLTFDRETGTAPAWTNSEILLSPILVQNEKGMLSETNLAAEHRMGMTVTRVLDPGWCYQATFGEGAEDLGEVDAYSASRTWMIRYQADRLPQLKLAMGDGKTKEIIKTTASSPFDGKEQVFDVKMQSDYVDDMGEDKHPLTLCRIAKKTEQQVHLLHQPLGDKRYRLTILVDPPVDKPDNRVKQGSIMFPRVVTSIEWSIPAGDSKERGGSPTIAFSPDSRQSIEVCGASAPTDIHWVRTSRNSGSVWTSVGAGGQVLNSLRKPGESGAEDAVVGKLHAGNLTVATSNSSRHVEPQRLPDHVPVSEHRHLAAWVFKQSRGIGLPVEQFIAGVMLNGASTRIGDKAAERINEAGLKDNQHSVQIRLLEFQTPAQPVYLGDPAAVKSDVRRANYKNGYFDTYSSSGTEVMPARLDFRLRLVRTAQVLADKPINALNISLTTAPVEQEPVTVSFELELKEGASGTVDYVSISVRLIDEVHTVYAEAVTLTGESIPLLEAKEVPGLPLSAGHGLHLAVDAIDLEGKLVDLWGDVSLLTGQGVRDVGEFDFDWLIPDAGDKRYDEAVTPLELKQLVECQAGFVCLSNPIHVDVKK